MIEKPFWKVRTLLPWSAGFGLLIQPLQNVQDQLILVLQVHQDGFHFPLHFEIHLKSSLFSVARYLAQPQKLALGK